MVATDSIFRQWWVEPFVATMSFAISINAFRILECRDAKAATSDIFDLRRSTRLLKAGSAYWFGIWLLGHVLPRAHVNYEPTLVETMVDLAAGVWAYDFVFYWLHRLMHRAPSFGRWVAHSTHHGPAKSIRAHHVLEHSVLDGSLQVLTNILVQRRGAFGGPKSWLARILHNVIVTYLLTESHADLDQSPDKWQGVASYFPTVLKGVRRHRAHHANAAAPYQQFFGYLDDLFSTPAPVKLSES